MDRREAIKFGIKAGFVVTAAGLVLNTTLKSNDLLRLRPPGALDESEFLQKCIRCGLCVSQCPYDTLHLATLSDNLPNGTPYFIPRKTPCYMCVDIPCVPACPTGALSKNLVSTNDKLDINKAKMGVAVVDMKNCVAYWGIQCDACYRACPLIDKAIKIKYQQNYNSGKHAYLLPVVDTDVCTGCGKCEHVCITQKAAIFVLPTELALGKVGTNYIKSWDKGDEERLKGAKTFKPKKSNALNYLNSGGKL